jgi:hypothetical protein
MIKNINNKRIYNVKKLQITLFRKTFVLFFYFELNIILFFKSNNNEQFKVG